MAVGKDETRILKLLDSVDCSLDALDDWIREFRLHRDQHDKADIEILSDIEKELANTVRCLQSAKDLFHEQ